MPQYLLEEEVLRGDEVRAQAVDYLGGEGVGVLHIPGAVTSEGIEVLLAEMEDPARVSWVDAGDTYVNTRGVVVEQNHDVFALRLSRGEQSQVQQVPVMKQLCDEMSVVVHGLSSVYPSLRTWLPDEMSYHRYYGRDVGLSFHKDNTRFWGVIAIATLRGDSSFQIIHREPQATAYDPAYAREVVTDWNVKSLYSIPVAAGSLVLMRGPGLGIDEQGRDVRPEHAVMQVQNGDRVSCMVRANNRPDEPMPGFLYANWQDD